MDSGLEALRVRDVDVDFKPERWTVSLAGRLSASYSSTTPESQSPRGNYCGTYELDLGVRKMWELDARWKPFVSGGVAVLGAGAQTHRLSPVGALHFRQDHDFGTGVWIETGAYWYSKRKWHLGASLAVTRGDLGMFDRRLDAGGVHLTALFGRHAR